MKLYVCAIAAMFLATDLAAQTKPSRSTKVQNEAVVIAPSRSGNTTIEINEDGVFVNGEEVASREDLRSTNLRKTITIADDRRARASAGRSSMRGAALGIMTRTEEDRVGAIVADVTDGSAAEEAGLKKGDVITRVDSTYIADAADLVNAIRKYTPGDEVAIRYRRGEKEHTTTATLNRAPAMGPGRWVEMEDGQPLFGPGIRRFFEDIRPMDRKPRLGMKVEEMAGEGGLRVLGVSPDMPAASAGIRKDDVIVGLEGNSVKTMDDFERHVEGLKPGNKLSLEILRNGNRMTRMLTLPKPRTVREF